MPESRLHRNRPAGPAALLALAAATLLAATACSSGGITVTGNAPTLDPASTSVLGAASAPASGPASAAAPAPTRSAAAGDPASSAAAVGPATGSAPLSVPACEGSELALGLGYGTQGQPVQAQSIVLTNVGGHTCTLLGFPGAAIEVDGRTFDAVRTLDGYGAAARLTAPPLVTLAPGASSYAVLEWAVGTGQGCYPAGTGVLEVTAPNTTRTVVLSRAMLTGDGRICSGFAVDPVRPGYFGVPVGVPARN